MWNKMLTISIRDATTPGMNLDRNRAEELLTALGELLTAAGERYEPVVIGGSALLALGLIDRTTRDVDIVAVRRGGDLLDPKPLPPAVVEARDRVARDFALQESWLNAAPSSLLDFGMPEGFVERLESRAFGPSLTVHFASRFDQIHFKLYAVVDQGVGKHESDLRALEPTPEELLAAARWTRTHDPSPGFRRELESVLRYFGVESGDLGS